MNQEPIRMIDIHIHEFVVPIDDNETEEECKQRILDTLRSFNPYYFGYGKTKVLSYDSETGRLISKKEI